jgi:transposase
MPKAHPPEFRRRAIELARAGGKAQSELARDLGISASCLRNGVAQADKDEDDVPPSGVGLYRFGEAPDVG